MKTYAKKEAIEIAKEFIKEVNKLEEKYDMSFNSDTGDIYFSFKSNEGTKVWDSISLGWDGDGSGIKVKESENIEELKQSALNKLTEKEKKVLGL